MKRVYVREQGTDCTVENTLLIAEFADNVVVEYPSEDGWIRFSEPAPEGHDQGIVGGKRDRLALVISHEVSYIPVSPHPMAMGDSAVTTYEQRITLLVRRMDDAHGRHQSRQSLREMLVDFAQMIRRRT